MDMKDFQNNFKYKAVLPAIYIINWLLMITGPLWYPLSYQILTIISFGYMCLKTVLSLIWCLIGFVQGVRYLNKYLKTQSELQQKTNKDVQNKLDGNQTIDQNELMDKNLIVRKLYHAFIIPSYKEDIQLLQDTLDKLAAHKDSKSRYLVFMAMEAHEEGSIAKAELLIEKSQSKFKYMSFSHHVIREYEQKGKASNVSWCVENLELKHFQKLGLTAPQVLITVMDADSWVPELYINELDNHVAKNGNRVYENIYQPCQIFTRNHLQVPILTRTYDQSHSLVHFCNLVTAFGAAFPLSNYTISFKLIKQIGFWDTCPDAIGEDFHTTLKAFWKTNGNAHTIFFHTPFNQVNVETGRGYWADVSARFWQAQRHARGCADAAYCFKMFFQHRLNWRTFIISFNSIQCFILPAILPWAVLGSTFQNLYNYFFGRPQNLVSDTYSSIFVNICTVCFILSYLLYFIFKRMATSKLYGLQNESFLRFVEFPLMIVPNLFLISVPTFTIAAFKVMLNKSDYNTAEKNIKSKKAMIEEIQLPNKHI